MDCYIIVTCYSMLWTILTVILTLSTLYSLTSTKWLIGSERFYEERYVITAQTRPDFPSELEYRPETEVMTRSYNPTIGLYNRCLRTSAQSDYISCGSFASNIGSGHDVFPISWQVSLVLSGVASLLLFVTMVFALLSLCVRDFCRKSIFTISGLIQVISGLFYSVAIAIYPLGWSSSKLHYFCGTQVAAFKKDQCSIGWAYIGVIICTLCIFPTGMLSIKADRATSQDEIEDEILKGKRLICIK
ncbi:LHFPL tetraspan subfamily member 2a protein-like [Watersipora subatra]|uniref:LHFPL tetraspan subfamily member 2a protein-like n=1 Tax=Watersipora subatra TaxID=2589382 RepID=UPI00355C987E